MSNEDKPKEKSEAPVTPWHLAIYYRRIFPSHIYCKWLAYGERKSTGNKRARLADVNFREILAQIVLHGLTRRSLRINRTNWNGHFVLAAACPQFSQREFSFTLENDVYRRYLSFANHVEFEKELIKMCPEKIDIGAVYAAKVIPLFNSLSCSSSDIDLAQRSQDALHSPILPHRTWTCLRYWHDWLWRCAILLSVKDFFHRIAMTRLFRNEGVRRSVRNAGHWCDWPCKSSIGSYMVCSNVFANSDEGEMILVSAEDFGFEHRLWIYSGRRGVHCWVSDQTARELQSSIRQAIVDHLTVVVVRAVWWRRERDSIDACSFQGGKDSMKRVNLYTPLHPSLQWEKRCLKGTSRRLLF